MLSKRQAADQQSPQAKRQRGDPTRCFARAKTWLGAGPLRVQGILDIIADYGQEFEGICTHTLAGDVTGPRIQSTIHLVGLPDDKLALGFTGTLSVWNAASGVRLHTLEGHSKYTSAMVVLSDGKLATGSYDHTVRVWENAECLYTLTGHTDWVGVLASLPDGKLASGSADHTIRVWENGACLRTLSGHTQGVCALAVLPDGKLASGSADHTVRVWR